MAVSHIERCAGDFDIHCAAVAASSMRISHDVSPNVVAQESTALDDAILAIGLRVLNSKMQINFHRSRFRRMVATAGAVLALFPLSLIAAKETAPLVIGDTFKIESKVLSETRRINVYLPPGYAEAAAKHFPVLYMPDGGMAEDFLHVAGLVQVSVGNGTMRPFILVGIENTERRRDMTGPTENAKDKAIAPRVGGSEAFRKFVRTELMAEVKARYRATDETAMVGESLAGLFVVETFLLEPDLFDTYIAFDPSLWWNNEALLKIAPERLGKAAKLDKTLYFAASSDMGDLAQRFADILTKCAPARVHWHYEPMPEEKHGTIYHPAALRAFRTIFKPTSEK
jgi:predicted alpha/beta superfamily hydrolase